ncbi:MAG: phosphonate metabolism protein PhnP [Chromatiales bacterium]|jgi:phosphoribosyl 1,2-cyclic phosphate phosphodiesterase
MRLTLLGTGNAAGMPVYGCDCEVCLTAAGNHLMQRTSCSALLQLGDCSYLLDAGQVNLAGRFPAGSLNGILLTHFHPDHVQGLFQLRWGTGVLIPVYCPTDPEGCADLYKHPGILQFQPRQKFVPFMLGDLSVTPLPLIHSKPTFGYLLEHAGGRIAYLTDTKGLPVETEELLAGQPLDLMVIDCSFLPGKERQGHNNLHDALSIHQAIAPRQTVLTHIGHDLDIWLRENPNTLPHGVQVGYDGQRVFADDCA